MDILAERAMFISLLSLFGLVFPLVFSVFYLQYRTYKRKATPAWYFWSIIIYILLFIFFGKDFLLPKKYEVKYIREFQCKFVDTMVPVYPDGIVTERK